MNHNKWKKYRSTSIILVLTASVVLSMSLVGITIGESSEYSYSYKITDGGDNWIVNVYTSGPSGSFTQDYEVDRKYSKRAVINFYERAKADYLAQFEIEYTPQVAKLNGSETGTDLLEVGEMNADEIKENLNTYYEYEVIDGGSKWIINIKYGNSYWDLSDTQEQDKRFPKEAVMNVYEKIKSEYLAVYGVTYEPKHYGSSITKNSVIAEIVEPHVEAPALPVSPEIPVKGDKYVGESAFPESAVDEKLYMGIAVILALVLCIIIIVLKWKP